MKKEDFRIGENITFKIYDYDDKNNAEYIKEISGKVYYKNDFFVTIDNGYYKECYKYCQTESQQYKDKNGNSYDSALEVYTTDIINNCLEDLEKKKIGYVFNYYQLNEVIKVLKNKNYITEKKDDLYYVELV